MILSIVMCTYNGEKYIIEQLESIRLQTRPADEVLIFDDCSTDKTVELIENYIHLWKLNWKITVNQKNKGWQQNFTDAFMEANGDIIFCSDQDDIWYSDKLEKMSELLIKEDIYLLGCKVKMINDKGKEVKSLLGKMPKSNESESLYYIKFGTDFYCSREPGCAIAFKKELLEYYYKYWEKECPHDQLLWNIAVVLGKAAEIDKILMIYRRTETSVFVKASKQKSTLKRKRKILDIEKRIATIDKIWHNTENTLNKVKHIKTSKKWINYRKKLVCDNKIIYAFFLVPYIKYYHPLIIYLVDIYDSIHKK